MKKDIGYEIAKGKSTVAKNISSGKEKEGSKMVKTVLKKSGVTKKK